MMIYSYKGEYLDKSDYIFTLKITDDDTFLENCINIEKELKDALFEEGSISDGMSFVNFLQMYYSNEEIIRIWQTIESIGPGLTQSGMQFFRAINERVLYSNFQKVENHFVDLFSEFARLRTIEKEWLKTNPINLSYYAINNIDYTV